MIWRFAADKGNEAIAYAKPKVDEFLEKHNSLVDTLRETQTKGTEAIGEIRKDLHCVKEQVEQNSGVLEQIRENTCERMELDGLHSSVQRDDIGPSSGGGR